MKIIQYISKLQCKYCSKISNEYFEIGLLEEIFDNESNEVIGLMCPNCKKTISFMENNINTFRCKSCHELFFERGSDIERNLCTSCDHEKR